MATRSVFVPETKKTIELPTEKEMLNMLIEAGSHAERGENAHRLMRSLGLTALKISKMSTQEREEWIRGRIKELTGRSMPKTKSVLNKSGQVRSYRIT